jgi:N-acetylmuramoyl-L-alanine amidase
MHAYVIREGDHLAGLAHRMQFDADSVWNDAKNEQLRQRRPNRDILLAGDVLFVPDDHAAPLPLSVGSSNSYVAEVPKVKTRVRFLQGDAPIANEACELVIPGVPPSRARSDGDGWVEFDTPVLARAVKVSFPALTIDVLLAVGHLDPVSAPSGMRMRLQMLGYYNGPWRGGTQAVLAAALRAFQRNESLDATGEPDEATRAALVQAVGC